MNHIIPERFRLTTAQSIFLTYLFVITSIIVINNLGIGLSVFEIIKDITHLDKVGHFLLFGILSYTLSFAIRHKSWQIGAIQIPIAPPIILFATFMEECSQIFIDSRTFSLLDLLANILGIACFGWLALWFTKKKKQKVDL